MMCVIWLVFVLIYKVLDVPVYRSDRYSRSFVGEFEDVSSEWCTTSVLCMCVLRLSFVCDLHVHVSLMMFVFMCVLLQLCVRLIVWSNGYPFEGCFKWSVGKQNILIYTLVAVLQQDLGTEKVTYILRVQFKLRYRSTKCDNVSGENHWKNSVITTTYFRQRVEETVKGL
jgi:hypothetical protein